MLTGKPVTESKLSLRAPAQRAAVLLALPAFDACIGVDAEGPLWPQRVGTFFLLAAGGLMRAAILSASG